MPDLLTASAASLVLHTRRARVPWDADLLTAARRLRGLGELMTMQCTRPALEVIAVGSLNRVTGQAGAPDLTAVASSGRHGAQQPARGGDAISRIGEAVAGVTVIGGEDDLDRAYFGFLAYGSGAGGTDPIRRRLNPVPDLMFSLPRVLVRREEDALAVTGRGPTPADAEQALRRVTDALARPAEPVPRQAVVAAPMFTLERSAFRRAVRAASEAILDGEIFQLVLSLGCTLPVSRSDPLRLHSRLAAINPSPLIFSYLGSGFSAAGASPEPLLLINRNRCVTRPFTGARVRGADHTSDLRAEAELVGSEPEIAKHRMVVNLARNDLGRVSQPGTVHVGELMSLQRQAHAMHLVSEVSGMLRPDRGPIDALRACFPAGPVTGSPKVRAMEIIDALEPTPRGLYGGAVGLISADSAALYLTLRSATLLPGRVLLQGGTGIVHDCDPHQQYDVCRGELRPVAAALDVSI